MALSVYKDQRLKNIPSLPYDKGSQGDLCVDNESRGHCGVKSPTMLTVFYEMAQDEKVPTKEDGLGLRNRRAFSDCGMRHPVLHLQNRPLR